MFSILSHWMSLFDELLLFVALQHEATTTLEGSCCSVQSDLVMLPGVADLMVPKQ
jgi:hypothetical protein